MILCLGIIEDPLDANISTILSGDTCAIEATSVSNTPYALFSFYATQTISRFIHYTYQYVLGGGPYVIPGGGGGGGS